MKILAVDLGKVRTGLAVCDPQECLASPWKVIVQRRMEQLADEVMHEAHQTQAEMFVIGLPKNMDGSEGDSAQNARSFARLLEEKSGLPVAMWDERGTTMTAHQYLNVTDTRGKKRKAVVDAVAAVIILQEFLDYRKNHPNP